MTQTQVRPRMQEKYDSEIVPALQEQFNYGNVMQLPKLTKIVVNIGMGEALSDANSMDRAVEDITAITGQKPIITKAKMSIANFRLREGNSVGVTSTMRGARMYEFLDRLINVALPRVRDFRGVNPKGMDGNGNYTLGIREQIIFQEIDYDNVDRIRGMNVTFVTSAKTDDEAYALLKHFGMPYRR